MVATVALTGAIRTLKVADRAEDWQAALAAAEAGVNDYLARLHRDDNYWRTFDCTNIAMKRRITTGTVPCGWGTTATRSAGLKVPGLRRAPTSTTTSTSPARPPTASSTLTSTGKVGKVTRTVRYPAAPRRFRRVPLLHRVRDPRPARA